MPRGRYSRRAVGRKALALGLTVTSIVGGLVAMVTFLLIAGHIGQLHSELSRARQERQDRLVEVLYAARTIGIGEVLREEDLAVLTVDRDYVPDLAVRERELLVGRIVRERIVAGDLLREERLAARGASGFAALLPDGTRAISVDLSPEWPAEHLTPGSSVDLLWTIGASDRRLAETVTLVQGAFVLSVGESVLADEDGEPIYKPRLALAMSPAEAERVTHAASLGPLAVSLRSDADAPEPEPRDAAPIGNEDSRMSSGEFFDCFSRDDVDEMALALVEPQPIAQRPEAAKMLPFLRH